MGNGYYLYSSHSRIKINIDYLIIYFYYYILMDKYAIIIQRFLRKIFRRRLKDGISLDIIDKLLNQYISNYNFLEEINKKLTDKKCRHENFPSHISENIVKFAIFKKYKTMPNWNTKKGDLTLLHRQIEVKGFSSDGPTSFGPSENWDWIYFVDCKDFKNKNFIVYEIKLSNKNEDWRKIILSGIIFDKKNICELPKNLETLNKKDLDKLCSERGICKGKNKEDNINKLKNEQIGSKFKNPSTYGSIADDNKRGLLRGCFHSIFKPQLGNNCQIIFNGNILDLENTKLENSNPENNIIIDNLTDKLKIINL